MWHFPWQKTQQSLVRSPSCVVQRFDNVYVEYDCEQIGVPYYMRIRRNPLNLRCPGPSVVIKWVIKDHHLVIEIAGSKVWTNIDPAILAAEGEKPPVRIYDAQKKPISCERSNKMRRRRLAIAQAQ